MGVDAGFGSTLLYCNVWVTYSHPAIPSIKLLFFLCAAYCSSVLFDKSTGILSFLRESAALDEVRKYLTPASNTHSSDLCTYLIISPLSTPSSSLCSSQSLTLSPFILFLLPPSLFLPPSSSLHCFQFATAQEELLRLLSDYMKILQSKVLPHSLEIKVLSS